ncbi:MAG: hypothetical protein AMXMBFR61_26230 [Fimbriimonadales bacterium]
MGKWSTVMLSLSKHDAMSRVCVLLPTPSGNVMLSLSKHADASRKRCIGGRHHADGEGMLAPTRCPDSCPGAVLGFAACGG